MNKNIFQAKDFKTRADLENQVRSLFNLTPEPKSAVIKGTTEELKNLSLSENTIFWGIKCEDIDKKVKKLRTKKGTFKKIDRGKRTNYGLNNKNYKPKTK